MIVDPSQLRFIMVKIQTTKRPRGDARALRMGRRGAV
jgi:hypothetical protein